MTSDKDGLSIMFSNKENVNILTSLLVAHGITTAVVCPGSRNVPIVHNLNECGSIRCVPITDERSAGFVALGMAQATGMPVAVCVTSGSALLNLAPAVAEAFYQHQPLVIISADRPAAWIDQLDGQTLPQGDALGRFVRKAVTLPEPHDGTECWHCNRLVNEALCQCTHRQPTPVHINVPITEPLFEFNVEALPQERTFKMLPTETGNNRCETLEAAWAASHRPMLVLGQMKDGTVDKEALNDLVRHAVVLCEPLGIGQGATHFDEVLFAIGDDTSLMPDLVIYVGGTIVSKRLRHFLRQAKAATYIITTDARATPDPTMWLSGIVECDRPDSLRQLLGSLAKARSNTTSLGKTDLAKGEFARRWHDALAAAEEIASCYEPQYSQMAAVKYFEEQIGDLEYNFEVHYANSSAVRLGNIYATHYVWCNRGVNGIEGSLSTAAGFSMATNDKVFCIIGDLSFLYDQNALWNSSLRGNLRIMLLNNHCGGIFHQLHGLEQSPARDSMVAAYHQTDAQGICTQNDIGYMKAGNMQEMQLGIVTLLTRQANRPMVLEITTNAEEDKQAIQEYYKQLRNILANRDE